MIGKKKLLDVFFAKLVSGSLILRLCVVLGALLVGFVVSIGVLAAANAEIDWPDHAIALALMAIAFSVSQWIEGIPIDPQLILARLSATTVVRLGLPLAGIVVMDRVVKPGFLAHTLVFWLVGFSLGLLTSSLISYRRLSQQT